MSKWNFILKRCKNADSACSLYDFLIQSCHLPAQLVLKDDDNDEYRNLLNDSIVAYQASTVPFNSQQDPFPDREQRSLSMEHVLEHVVRVSVPRSWSNAAPVLTQGFRPVIIIST